MKLCAKFATCYKKLYGECRTKKGVNYTDITFNISFVVMNLFSISYMEKHLYLQFLLKFNPKTSQVPENLLFLRFGKNTPGHIEKSI